MQFCCPEEWEYSTRRRRVEYYSGLIFENSLGPRPRAGGNNGWSVILGLHVYSSMGDMYIAVSPH